MILIPNEDQNFDPATNNRVLVVDDDVLLLEAYESILAPPQDTTSRLQAMAGLATADATQQPAFQLTTATQGQQGFALAKTAFENNTPYAVAFVDVRMPPGWNGLQTAIELRRLDPRIYVVMVTAYSDFSINEIQIGVQHNVLLIHKPFTEDEIYQLARNLTQSWNRDQELLSLKAALEHKVTVQESQIYFQMVHDQLTGLFNRDEFEKRLTTAIHRAKIEKETHQIFVINIDKFRIVNESCGQLAGDQLIGKVATLLRKKLRKHDSLARLSADEFAVLMEYCSTDTATNIAQDLLEEIKAFNFKWKEKSFDITTSIGMASVDFNATDASESLRFASAACNEAKNLGGQRIYYYQVNDANLEKRFSDMQWISRINLAISEERLLLFAQEILPLSLDADTGKHYEILVRMRGEQGEVIPPGAFLPIAENFQLMLPIDRQVIKGTFEWLSNNPLVLEETSLCSINLAGQSLGDESLMDFIQEQAQINQIPTSKICFEITETSAIRNISTGLDFIQHLKTLGFTFSLDDFGSGLSSFAYLKNLPVDYVKIDGLFVKDIAQDKINRELVKSINDIAHVMGKKTVAEFAENAEIIAILKAIGVDYAQGYGISKPKPLAELAQVVQPSQKLDRSG